MFQGIRRGFGCAIRSMNQRGAPPARRPALCPAPSGISCFVLQPHNSAKAFARFSSGRTRRETPQVLPAFVYGFDLVAGPIKIVGRLHLRVSLNGDAAVLQIPVSASAETCRQTRRSSASWAGARPLFRKESRAMGQSGKARRGIRAQAAGPGRFASAGGGPQQRPGPAGGRGLMPEAKARPPPPPPP